MGDERTENAPEQKPSSERTVPLAPARDEAEELVLAAQESTAVPELDLQETTEPLNPPALPTPPEPEASATLPGAVADASGSSGKQQEEQASLRDKKVLGLGPGGPVLRPRPTPPRELPPEPEAPPEPRKPPEWKVLEPEDRSDPVEHEVCELTHRNARWNLLAASVRGKLHAHKALWRDDAYAHGAVEDWTIVAVSDGAGSARISRVGARIACDEALRTLKELLSGYRLAECPGDYPSDPDMKRVQTFLAEAARKAQRGILREAALRGCPARDLNATLLLALHCPWQDRDFVAALQIGDGAIGLFLDDDTCTVLGIADHGEYSSETRFLTTPNIEQEFDQRVLFCCKKGMRCLAALCDGVSDDFFPEEKRLIELFIGNPIKDLKARVGGPVWGLLKAVVKQPNEGKALLDWLRYEKKGSSDDRTLVLMYRSDQG